MQEVSIYSVDYARGEHGVLLLLRVCHVNGNGGGCLMRKAFAA